MLAGEQLPTLTELQERFNVSRNTVVAAIQILKDEGLVIGQRGWGTFVADQPPTR
jgi:DNA-binding GntR family transcriptional regulator